MVGREAGRPCLTPPPPRLSQAREASYYAGGAYSASTANNYPYRFTLPTASSVDESECDYRHPRPPSPPSPLAAHLP